MARSEYRDWMGKNGKTIHAAFISLDSETGTVKFLRKIQDAQGFLPGNDDFISTNIENLSEDAYRDVVVQDVVDNSLLKNTYEGDKGKFYYGLGYQYFGGEDGDPYLSAYYLKLSAEEGYVPAYSLLSEILRFSKIDNELKLLVDFLEHGVDEKDKPSMEALGQMFMDGRGVRRNFHKARTLFIQAASGDDPRVSALDSLSKLSRIEGKNAMAADYAYRYGKAMLENEANWPEEAVRNNLLLAIDDLVSLGATDLANGLRRELYSQDDSEDEDAEKDTVAFGTGWFCGPRHVVTCWHVLEGRENFFLVSGLFEKTSLRLVVKDDRNDLAVLEIIPEDVSSDVSLPIAKSPAEPAQEVFTTGFPHVGLLGKEPKYTDGSISATTGIGDDPRILQISVPVQSGNSGGPLLDSEGKVVGVVSSKLSAAKVFEWTGDLPQNINYAVKSAYLKILLDSKRIPYSSESLFAEGMDRSDVLPKINRATVQILAE